MNHILLNSAFLLFSSIFGEIHREIFFLDLKVFIADTSIKILRKFVFPTMLERCKPEEILDLFNQLFLIKPVKGDKYEQKLFFSTRWATLLNYAFLLLRSIFEKIHRELFFLDIKMTTSETNTDIFRKFVFLTLFERGKPEENFDLFKQLFLTKPLKEDKY